MTTRKIVQQSVKLMEGECNNNQKEKRMVGEPHTKKVLNRIIRKNTPAKERKIYVFDFVCKEKK